MHYEFHPEARIEYLEAIVHYEKRQTGLGTRFTVEIESAIQRIVEAPNRWPQLEGNIRRCLTNTFPYGLLYSLEPDYILVLAVMHYSRKPGYWRSRT